VLNTRSALNGTVPVVEPRYLAERPFTGNRPHPPKRLPAPGRRVDLVIRPLVRFTNCLLVGLQLMLD
jgi:hypothetical protein